MKTRRLLPIVAFLLLGLAFVGARANGGLPVYEMPFNPSGSVFEVNRDAQGRLWVSDYNAGEIWALDPVSQGYTRHAGLGYPGDARLDANNSVWYTDGTGEYLGQIVSETGSRTLWEAAGSGGLYAIQVDGDGIIWATSWFYPLLYRFDSVNEEMCSYDLPALTPTKYIAVNAQGIWLADSTGAAVFRLEPNPDPAKNQFTIWDLPASTSSQPVGLDIDSSGSLWWADYDQGSLHRLEVSLPGDADLMTVYDLPISGSPTMLDASGSLVLFTDDLTGLIGSLDPATASGIPEGITPRTESVVPDCDSVDPITATPATITRGRMDFTPNTYTALTDSSGWRIWQVPDNPAPYGVRAAGKSVWVADYGRQALIWRFSGSVVSACKLADADGDLNTTNDQSPVAGWRVYLKVDGTRQEPGQLTRDTGCYTWLDLESGHAYAVEEELPDGWEALTGVEKDFGLAVEGQYYSFSFINKYSEKKVFLPLIIR